MSKQNDNRPALLNIKSMPVNSALQFSTDVLDPVIFSQDFCRFELNPKGFLHPNSQITIQMKSNGVAGDNFPFVNVGLYSMVQRAVLKTADGTTLCSTEDLPWLMACKSQFVTGSSNLEREQFKTGRGMAYEQVFDDESGKSATTYGLANGLEYNTLADGVVKAGYKQGLNVQQHLRNSQESTFSLSLNDLFPYLKSGNQLPLFMMPRVQLELYWTSDASKSRCVSPTTGSSFEIKQTQFFADYLFYDGEFMENYREKNPELSFTYIDYRLSKNSITQAQALNSVRNVGGNGMLVTKVFHGYEVNKANPDEDLLGPYVAVAPEKVGATAQRGDLTQNLFFNNEFLYPQNVTNSAVHYHHLISAEGAPAYVSRAAYSGEGEGITTDDLAGLGQDGELLGQNFWQGFKLIGNDRLDSKGIDLHAKIDISGDAVNRVWLEVLRYATLTNGKMNVFYA